MKKSQARITISIAYYADEDSMFTSLETIRKKISKTDAVELFKEIDQKLAGKTDFS